MIRKPSVLLQMSTSGTFNKNFDKKIRIKTKQDEYV